jgi:SAM-dependent methyltransferase
VEGCVCLLCGGEDAREVIRTAYGNGKEQGEFRLVKCLGCGLVYLNPRPTREEMGSYYPSTYGPYQPYDSWRPSRQHAVRRAIVYLVAHLHYNTPALEPAIRFLVSSRAIRALLERVTVPLKPRLGPLPHYRHPGRLLEVGCGVGTYLDLVSDLGWRTYGVEISPEASRLAQAKGHRIYQGSFERATWPPVYFQAACLWHALEHLHDPAAALRKLQELMAPGAELLIEVPNWESRGASHFGGDWYALDLPRHLCFLTLHTLRRLLVEAGFQPDRIWTVPDPDYIRRSQRSRRGRLMQAGLSPTRCEFLERGWLAFNSRFRERGDLIRARAIRP